MTKKHVERRSGWALQRVFERCVVDHAAVKQGAETIDFGRRKDARKSRRSHGGLEHALEARDRIEIGIAKRNARFVSRRWRVTNISEAPVDR